MSEPANTLGAIFNRFTGDGGNVVIGVCCIDVGVVPITGSFLQEKKMSPKNSRNMKNNFSITMYMVIKISIE